MNNIPSYIIDRYTHEEIQDMLIFRKRGFEWDECETTLEYRKDNGLFKDN